MYGDANLLVLTLVPGPPTEFTGVSNNSTSIAFTFKPPKQTNDGIENYSVQCYTTMINDNNSIHMLNLNATQNTATLTGLQPYTNYSCNITAHNVHGEGLAATTRVATMQDGK